MKFPLKRLQKSLLATSALIVVPVLAAEYEPPSPVTNTKIYFGCNLDDFKGNSHTGCTPVEEYSWQSGGSYMTGYQYTHGFFINGSLGAGTGDANSEALTALQGKVDAQGEELATHTASIADNTQAIQGLTGDVNALTGTVNGLEGRLQTAEGSLSALDTRVMKNTETVNNNKQAIDANKRGIADNQQAIAGNASAIANNTKAIADNKQAIAANTQSITDNKQAIDANKRGIVDNQQAIAVNTSAIANNTKAIADNKQAIAANMQSITDNKQAIDANKRGIADNQQAIAVNTSAIANNTKAIASNKQAIAGNKADIHDVKTRIAKGINIAAGQDVSNYQLGDTVRFVGGTNIQTNLQKGSVIISLVDNPQFNHEVSAKGGLVAHQYLTTPTDTIIDFGGNRVRNVGNAQHDSDAVNLRQLKSLHGYMGKEIKNVHQQLRQARKTAHAGTASALAVASLPQAWDPSQIGMSLGTAIYRGETGYALGLSRMSETGRWVVKGALTADSRGGMGASVGAFFAFE